MRADRDEEGTIPESTRAFDRHRPLLFSIAYRMLGSVMEAEDAVQEAYLRWRRAPGEEVRSERAYLSAVVTRLCTDPFVRTRDTTGKPKRVRNDPSVEICPSTVGGRPTGPATRTLARVLEGEESAYAGRMLTRKYPVLHGFPIPLVHRLRGNGTTHTELEPVDNGEVPG